MREQQDYKQAMADGARQYSDVLDLLADRGYRAAFTQTGGMCAAIEMVLDRERYALITDAEGPLSWEREDQQGWAVSIYEYADTSEAVVFESTPDSALEALVQLLPTAA